MRTLTLLITCVFFICIKAGIILETPDPNFKHNGHCYAQIGAVGELKKGETKIVPGRCLIADCKEDRSVLYTGCAPFEVPFNCKIIQGDLKKPYPHCCDQEQCWDPPRPKLIVYDRNLTLNSEE